MSDIHTSSAHPLSELITYRDKMALIDPSTYQGAYVDGLNMAIFLVQAAIHRNQLAVTRAAAQAFEDIKVAAVTR